MKKITFALVTGILLSSFVLTGCSSAAPGVDDGAAPAADVATSEAATATNNTVTYEVTSDAATAGNISYLTFNDGSSGQEQATEAPLPFTNEVTLEDGGLFSSSIFSLVAQASAEATTISCKITVNGEVIADQTSSGAYAVVTCSGSSK
ncbi:MmpS family transport accessory protein [Cryobacterium sp. Y57]|uniref:MmpS family transport accessory protein n=1 Tax=Cryobacterium sp. Y57 TaxID=2048287 RepID=UPI000CE38F34|nr:MmpS family transport accessory protein [Cryobacterium sp. Y57]